MTHLEKHLRQVQAPQGLQDPAQSSIRTFLSPFLAFSSILYEIILKENWRDTVMCSFFIK